MARFIRTVSADIPWHVTAFHRDYRMQDPANTDARMLKRAAEIGYTEGLRYVYAGNLPGRVAPYEDTRCPACQTTLIKRLGFTVLDNRITPDGLCPKCQTAIPGIWRRPDQRHLDHSPTPCG
jgi:pyruvate formate lyase activating enzyme